MSIKLLLTFLLNVVFVLSELTRANSVRCTKRHSYSGPNQRSFDVKWCVNYLEGYMIWSFDQIWYWDDEGKELVLASSESPWSWMGIMKCGNEKIEIPTKSSRKYLEMFDIKVGPSCLNATEFQFDIFLSGFGRTKESREYKWKIQDKMPMPDKS